MKLGTLDSCYERGGVRLTMRSPDGPLLWSLPQDIHRRCPQKSISGRHQPGIHTLRVPQDLPHCCITYQQCTIALDCFRLVDCLARTMCQRCRRHGLWQPFYRTVGGDVHDQPPTFRAYAAVQGHHIPADLLCMHKYTAWPGEAGPAMLRNDSIGLSARQKVQGDSQFSERLSELRV